MQLIVKNDFSLVNDEFQPSTFRIGKTYKIASEVGLIKWSQSGSRNRRKNHVVHAEAGRSRGANQRNAHARCRAAGYERSVRVNRDEKRAEIDRGN